MNEEERQSVRYSQVMSDFTNDSSVTPTTQLSMTRRNEAKSLKRNRIVLGIGVFAITVSIVIIIAVVFSKKSSTKTTNASESSLTFPNAVDDATNKVTSFAPLNRQLEFDYEGI